MKSETVARKKSSRIDKETVHDETPAHLEALARTTVFQRLPATLRSRVDGAILMRPKGLRRLEEIVQHFKLEEHDVSAAALATYARQLEELIRPAATGQVMAAFLGWLPKSYQRRLQTGTQVLLLSRVMHALSDDKTSLSVSELARLGAVLSSLERPEKSSKKKRKSKGQTVEEKSRLADLVRGVYGIDIREDAHADVSSNSATTVKQPAET